MLSEDILFEYRYTHIVYETNRHPLPAGTFEKIIFPFFFKVVYGLVSWRVYATYV